MSTPTEPRARRRADEGFTLIEVIVALSIFAVVSVAALPLVLLAIKTGQAARVETLAKDLSQLRLERMRNLAYQVDRQNGPFVDLLDRYFSHAASARPPLATDEADCTGVYLTAAPGTGGAPSGPAYRVTCTALPEAQGYAQVVYAQFLVRTGSPVTPPGGYDSQVVGADSAPSRLLGVTVLTSWDRIGQKGQLRTYTEIADTGTNRALVTTQAQALALRVTSNSAADGRSLVAEAGEVKADGSLTTGSVAAVRTVGATLDHIGTERRLSSLSSVVAPGSSGSAAEVSEQGIAAGAGAAITDWTGCGWGWFGKSAFGGVTASTALGLPRVPAASAAVVDAAGSPTAQAGLLNSGNGCQGYAFGFRNWLNAPSFQSALNLTSNKPQVYVLDPNAGGGLANGRALGEASVTASDLITPPHSASAIARARVSTVFMLPTKAYPNGLVSARLNSSSLTCKSDGTVAGAYSLTVTYPGGSKTVTYPSATPPSLPAPSSITWNETAADGVTVLPRRLSDYLTWDVNAGVTESSSGARSIDHVFAVQAPESAVGPGGLSVQLGLLSCTAADNR